jgi:hypothetical protein
MHERRAPLGTLRSVLAGRQAGPRRSACLAQSFSYAPMLQEPVRVMPSLSTHEPPLLSGKSASPDLSRPSWRTAAGVEAVRCQSESVSAAFDSANSCSRSKVSQSNRVPVVAHVSRLLTKGLPVKLLQS